MTYILNSVYIIAAKRTPIGAFQGQLSSFQGWQLGAEVMRATSLHTHLPEEVIMGCVLAAGQGQAPARQATRAAFDVDSIPATTINKVCGSGMQAIAFAYNALQVGQRRVMMAGGFESMSNAPYLLSKGRSGYRMGHGSIYDHMLFDGLEDAYGIGTDGTRRAMGIFADATAEKYSLSRSDQEAFALKTYENYQKAESDGLLAAERAPLTIDLKGNTTLIEMDEPPTRVKPSKFEMLRPAFGKNGTVTAATSSGIADGAAALLLCTEDGLLGQKPLVKIAGFTTYACAPEWFTTAPTGAIKKLLDNLAWTINDVDLFEINEAFAVVPMAVMIDLGISPEKVNVHGGACTLGHPIGASGARIVVTLIHALRARGLKRGIASACIGGGEATAIAVEVC